MKVRWNASSLRLRITPSELALILNTEPILEGLTLPGGLRWQVSVQPATETRLAAAGQSAIVYLSPDDRQRLAAPDAEGVYFGTDDGLRFFVEKDFPCVHPRAAELLEAPTETFDAPGGFEQRKQEMIRDGE